jgi:hypothetical protein
MYCRKETSLGLKAIPGLISVVILASFLSMVFGSVCFASTVVLQWEPVADSDLGGYKVYYQADSSAQPFQGTGADQGPSPIVVPKNLSQTTATISGLDLTRSYYFAVVAYNTTGIESPYSNIVTIHPLAVNLSGNGSGSINSNPSAITCESGTCVLQFGSGSSLTLYATPSSNSSVLSYFSGWTGACNSTNSSCTVEMTASKSVTANFSSLQPVHIAAGSYYSSIQSAYGAAANNSNIQAQAVTLSGNFTTSSTKAITLQGGYNATYSGNSGYTVMAGTLSVGKGTLIVDRLVIK